MTSEENNQAALELRIVAGWHEGARAPFTGAALCLAAPDAPEAARADVLLRDAAPGVAVSLEPAAEGWTWRDLSEAASAPLTLRLDADAVRCGGAVICLAAAASPWRRQAELTVHDCQRAAAPAVTAAGESAETASPVAASVAASAVAGAAALPAAASASASPTALPSAPVSSAASSSDGRAAAPARRSPWLAGGVAAAFVLLLFIGVASLLVRLALPEEVKAPPPAPQLDAAGLRDLIVSLQLAGRYRVIDQDGRLALEGIVAGEDERERINNALALFAERPRLDLLSNGEMLLRANALAAAPEFNAQLRSPALGEIEISGISRDAASAAQLVERLRDDLPGVVSVRDASRHAPQLIERFQTALREVGLQPMQVAWDGAMLRIDGALDDAQVAIWEKVILALDAEFAGAVPLYARMDMPPAGAYLRQRLRAVVSGPAPYVVLADGRKVQAGGEVGQYRLLGVRDRTSLWELRGATQPFAIER